MRYLLLLALLLGLKATAQTNPHEHWVDGHLSNGVWISGYWATDPNETNRDNYSTHPNINPHTGQQGTVQPVPGGLQQSYATGGEPIWIATSGQIPWNILYQRQQNQQPRLTPEEREARQEARAIHRMRMHANYLYERQQQAIRKQQRKDERAKKKAAREYARSQPKG